MQNPDKPFKTYDEQVSILKSRNVYIKNEEIVKQCLTDISYYSLINGYKDLFDSDINGKFSYPVPFTDFYFLYNFDRDINSILLKYIIMVERALKSNITYRISENMEFIQIYPIWIWKMLMTICASITINLGLG